MNIHVLSTNSEKTSFEAVSANVGDTLFVDESETISVVDENEEPIPFSTNWVGGEAIIKLADGNWFSVVGLCKERSDVAVTDYMTPVSIALLVKDFHPDNMLLAMRIDGERLRIDKPYSLDSGATVTLQSTGRISYDPNGAFDEIGLGDSVEDVFSYTISNSEGGFSSETVTVTISGDCKHDFSDATADVQIEMEDISEPLFGTMATLHPNGTITYFEEAPLDLSEETQVDFAEGENTSGGDVTIHFIQEEEKIERTDVLSPLLGATATLKSDGSIEYTTDSKIAAPVSEGGPVAALSSFLLFPPVLATAQT